MILAAFLMLFFLPDIIRSVFEKKKKLIIRNPNSIRPWQYVLEDLEGYLLLAKKLYGGKKEFSEAWNFGPDSSENCLTVEELAKKSFKILNRGFYEVKKDPAKHEAEVVRLNIDKAKIRLGWEPKFDIDKTLEATFAWYNNFYAGKNCVDFTDKQIKLFFK